jgi:hypothetical protein
MQANGLGLALTLGLPLLAVVCWRGGWPGLAALVPPGSVYAAVGDGVTLGWLVGPVLAGLLTFALARVALVSCDQELRNWLDRHQGRKVLD